MGVLSPARGNRTSRGIALAGIVVLHIAAIGLAMAMKGLQPDAAPASPPIEVTLAPTLERPPAPHEPVKVTLETPPVAQAVVPVIQIDLPQEPPPAITVAAVATPAPPSPPSEGDGPVAVSQPDYLQPPHWTYPPAAKRARVQGTVHVRALVDLEGRAQDVSVAHSSGSELLDRAACDAVRGARFKPYRRNNIPRSMLVIVPVEFSLTQHMVADSELDVRRQHHDPMRRHPEELGGLGAAALHVGEQPETQVGE